MDGDDDWDIGEDFLDDFIPRDEISKTVENTNEESPKRQKLDSVNSETSIYFHTTKNENSPEQRKIENNSRLNKILKICSKTTRHESTNEKSKSPEIPQNSCHEETNFNIHENFDNVNEINFPNENRENQQEENFQESNLEIFQERNQENFQEENPQNFQEKNPENRVVNFQDDNQELTRKNLIKSILNRTSRKNEQQIEETEKCGKMLNRQNLLNSILKRNENKRKETEESTESKIDNFPILQKSKRNVSFSDDSNKTIKRQQLILNYLKKSDNNDAAEKSKWKDDSRRINESKNNSRSRNDSKSTSRSKKVITRKFPGPAGLLPENLDLTNFPMAYLNSFDESENERRMNDTRISNFCSQNTKNRFTSGAWQLLIDDLPVDFLLGQEIGIIKKDAKNGLYKTKRTGFLAAIVHHIDSNCIVNPMIILKDSTDEIEASVHRVIFLKFPNIIQIGTVILLQDVIIISTKAYVMALIHPRDVVAIYNENERIVTTEMMEKILKDQEGNGDEEREICNEERLNSEEDSDKQDGNARKEMEERTPQRNEDFNESDLNHDRENPVNHYQENVNSTQILNNREEDEFLSQLNLEEISASQGPINIVSSTLIGTQIRLEDDKSPDNNLRREKSSKLHNILKQFRHREDVSQPIVERPSIETRPEENKTTRNFTDLVDSEEEIDEELVSKKDITLNNENNIEKTREKNTAGTSKLSSRLKQFRHREDLSQPEVETKHKENMKETSNFANLLLSDDEMEELPNNASKIESANKSNQSSENVEDVRNVRNLFNDQADEILSQMNIDDFEIDEENF